jgi:hypothetical protein
MNCLSASSHKGELGASGSLFELSANSTVLSSVGLTRDGSLLARVYETCGKADNVSIKLPFNPSTAKLVDLDENVLGDAAINGGEVTFPVAANCIAAVKIGK